MPGAPSKTSLSLSPEWETTNLGAPSKRRLCSCRLGGKARTSNAQASQAHSQHTIRTGYTSHSVSISPPSPSSPYRGRLAPSPTGYLHIGHARTFFSAFERARAANGTLVLRMEDLDPDRSRNEYAAAALEDLQWLGVRWHEGPDVSGPYAPYAQSQRDAIYLAAWRRLLQGGFLYPCRCSRKDLAAALSAPHENTSAELDPLDDEPVYPGTCRPAQTHVKSSSDEMQPEGCNWRFRVPDAEVIEFNDLNFGPQRFIAGVGFGDFVVWRRDIVQRSPRTELRPWGGGTPSYQLACVADDAAMAITEVVRGADLLKSTARQILLNRALGFTNPAWFHCTLAVDHRGRRLAKRHDALSIRTLRQRGFTPADFLSANLPIGPDRSVEISNPESAQASPASLQNAAFTESNPAKGVL
jgi:glutamyl/glutaminyl-tRNA synthetase